ncbi:MAG: hypothetical protein ACI9TF_001269, partial [Paracrocinitomix sp.]
GDECVPQGVVRRVNRNVRTDEHVGDCVFVAVPEYAGGSAGVAQKVLDRLRVARPLVGRRDQGRHD